MIEASGLTKRYGESLAVDGLTFTVRPGVVTGFLGPNGAGKSTTMRMILGLESPTSGRVTVNGMAYPAHRAPLQQVGALLEARSVQTGRTAYHHLLALAQTHGIGKRRVREVIELVGLSKVARCRAGAFSLGMGQRLGIAAALLGDPDTLILDEPVNGLDPEGVIWVRVLLQGLAAQGRTVFVSSHLMAEMALTAQHLVVIGEGRLMADVSMRQFIDRASRRSVRVRSSANGRLAGLLAREGAVVSDNGGGVLEASGLTSDRIRELAAAEQLVVYELIPRQASLEDAFMELTGDAVRFRAHAAAEQEIAA